MNEVIVRVLESGYGLPVLLLVKATLLLALGYAGALLLSKRSAAVRHLVWALTAAMLLVLPLAARGVPEWRVPVAPAAVEAVIGDALEGGASASGSAELAVMTVAPDQAAGVGREPAMDRAGARAIVGRVASPAGVLLLWAAGAAVVLAWLLLGQVLLRRVLRRAVALQDADWEVLRRDAAWLLEVGRPVRLLRSRSVSVPVTWGVLRPVVVLPEESESWPEARRRVVLLHEYAHVGRLDGLTQLVAGLACAAYWFHPGVWYAARRMRVEREHACDDLVLSAGTPGPEYAAHLLELARRYRRTLTAPMLALPMARPSHLEGRVLRVLAGPSGRRAPTRRRVAAAGAAMFLLTLPVAALQPVASTVGEPEPRVAETPATVALTQVPEEAITPAPQPAEEPRAPAAAVPAAGEVGGVPAPLVVAADTPPPSPREGRRSGTITISDAPDSIARLIPRQPLSAAAYAITSFDGRAALLLRDTTIVLQLTDRGLEEIGTPDADEEERGFLTALLGSMLRGGLRMLLDRGLEYSLADLREARYESGRLVLENRRGNDIFENVQVNGGPIMESFAERDAREFAQRVNRARARLR
jgi:beta-lactamase regulating signal transducer with metallopeptidase domain